MICQVKAETGQEPKPPDSKTPAIPRTSNCVRQRAFGAGFPRISRSFPEGVWFRHRAASAKARREEIGGLVQEAASR